MNKEDNFPFVSIIIPAYNGERFLKKSIPLLLNQSYPLEKYEIIVVDNGSTDNTQNLLNSFSVINAICHKKGPSAARNAGIKQSKGEICLFIDCDCLADKDLIKNHVKRHLEFIKQKSNYKIIGGSIEGYNTNYWSLCDDFCSWAQYHPRLHSRYNNFYLPTANLSVRKEVFEESGFFNENLYAGEDVAFCIMASNNNIRTFYEPLAAVKHINRTRFKELLIHQFQWADASIFKEEIVKLPKGINLVLFLIIFFIGLILKPIDYSIRAKRFNVIFVIPFIIIGKSLLFYQAVKEIIKVKNEMNSFKE